MRTTLVILLVALSLIPLTNLVSPPATGANIIVEISRFDNGKPEVTVDFVGATVDSTYGLSLQTGLYVDEVRMKISSVAQPPGSKDYPTGVSIDFGGDKALEWAWKGPAVGALGRQSVFLNNRPAMNASVPYTGGYNDSVGFRLPKTATVRSATLNVSTGGQQGTEGKLLLLMGEYPWGNYYNDVVNKLQAFPSFTKVDTFDAYSKTPTWDDIKDYRYILTWTMAWYGYGYKDTTGVGNLLADFVDAGGSLVTAEGCSDGSSYSPGGRFAKEGYAAIPIGSGYHSYSSHSLGDVPDPNDPVMKGVSSLSDYYWTPNQKNPPAGGSVIAYWNDGHLLAARNTVSGTDTIGLGFYPVSTNYHYAGWDYYTNGAQLMANALLNGGRKPVTVAVDLLNDGTEEFNRTNFLGDYTIPDFSTALNSFIARSPVSYSDAYGNDYVDIPINMSSPKSGFLSFNRLDVRYDYTTAIDANPVSGNLTMAVSDLQPSVLGEENNTIPMYISSTSSGKLKLHDLYVRMTPPAHSPRVDSFYPAQRTVINEHSTLELGVNATDIYGNPMTYAWFRDGEPVSGASQNRLSTDFGYEAAGNHTIMARIANGISEKTHTDLTWQIVVLNLNRPPEITSSLPAGDVSMNENATQRFEVDVSDPDSGDGVTYSWFTDGRKVDGATGDNFTYAPGFFDSGAHTVKAVVADTAGASDTRTWQVAVVDVNLPPLITDWTPKEDPRIPEMQGVTFGVTASDPDKDDRVTVNWFFDDVMVFVGNPFTFVSDYRSAGVHKVRAQASDGDALDQHAWTLTVDNVNRLPQATIDSPKDSSESMEGQALLFSARSSSDPDNETLSFIWKEGGVNVSDQMEFERAFPPGIHTLTLEVRDQSGGKATSTVRFRVRFIEMSVAVGLDRLDLQAGDKVEVVLTMSNVGDTNATDVPVELQVDGRIIGTTTIKDLAAGGVAKAAFLWKATSGPHTLTAKVGEGTWTKEVTVAKAPPPPPAAGIGEFVWPIVIVVMAVGLVGFGAMALRRK